MWIKKENKISRRRRKKTDNKIRKKSNENVVNSEHKCIGMSLDSFIIKKTEW